MLQGQASKTFENEDYKKYGGFGNYAGNKFVSSNQRMNEIGEDTFWLRWKYKLRN